MALPRIINGPSTAGNWTATCTDDSVAGALTFPRTVLCSFATATSSLLVVAGSALTITTTTSLGAQGTRYITG
jgi:hypothetical protein